MPSTQWPDTMSNNFTRTVANVYFTRCNVSKFQEESRKTTISNSFKENLMSNQLKSGRKVTWLARNLRRNSFPQTRLLSTNAAHNFHQRNPPGQNRPIRSHLLRSEPHSQPIDDSYIAGTCYIAIVFAFLLMNIAKNVWLVCVTVLT